MDWFKKHTDTMIVLGAILSSVLIMQKIMPGELAKTEKNYNFTPES